MSIGDRIKKRRLELGLSQEELALRLGYTSRSTINKIELGINDITQSKVVQFANALRTTPGYLMDWESDEDLYRKAGIGFIRIPLYGMLCCGNGGFVDDNIIEYIAVPSKGLSETADYFCQIANGESMKDAGIGSGDLLVFEKIQVANAGMIGCFCIGENDAVCKKYKEQAGIIMLQPMNSEFESIIVDPLNESFRCLGKLRKVIKDFD